MKMYICNYAKFSKLPLSTSTYTNCLNLGTSNHDNQYQSELNWVSFTADQCDHRRDEVNEMRGLDELNYI